MASPLAETHIEAQARLRQIVSTTVGRQWTDLGSWDERDVPRFLDLAVPVVTSGQRASVALTEAFLARSLERRPLGVRVADLIGAGVRNGTPPAVVYRRPFVTLWTALGDGKPFADGLSAALARVEASAATDVQLSSRATYGAVQEADGAIFGYQRVADGGACKFCQEVDGAYVKSGDAMPLHSNCGCGLDPLTAPHPRAANLPSGVAVHEHGELGPVLADPAHDFTAEDDF